MKYICTDDIQVTVPIRLLPLRSAGLLQDVRIHTELLRLLELHRPSYALHEDLNRRQCEKKVQ